MTLSLAKAGEILGSPKPLNLDSLRFLNQRWDSPQATSGMPYPSCINASSFFVEANALQNPECLAPVNLLPITKRKLEQCNRTR
ncbi:MAG: hypothetical protein AN490_03205 [Anabaena sp. AL09]|nr:MAG: hypothetical protein AN490_03205 [Anabaena sp. AL09]